MKLKTKYNIGDTIYYYKTPSYDLKDIKLLKGKIISITYENNKTYYNTTLGRLKEEEIYIDLKKLTDYVITEILVHFGKLYKQQIKEEKNE